MTRRPPLGVTPRFIHEEMRMDTLQSAIYRYLDAGQRIPPEWVAEYNELLGKVANK